jgi:MSHA pilin protein MshA
VALPKFVDLSGDARKASIDGAAGALSSASAINYAAYMVNTTNGVRLNTASGAALLTAQMASWDAKFSISGEANCAAGTAGSAAKATLSLSGGTSASTAVATIICTG